MTGSETITRGQPVPWLVRRALLTCGVIGPPLFVVTFLVAGLTRPDYSPMRHPVSSLALGDSGWVQTVNFCSRTRSRSGLPRAASARGS